MLLCQQMDKTHSKYHLITAEPPFTPKTINCMHHTGPRTTDSNSIQPTSTTTITASI